MSQYKLHQTVFVVEKLRNIVGISGSTAYHILTTPGKDLGTMGNVAVVVSSSNRNPVASNEEAFDTPLKHGFNRVVEQIRSALIR